MASPKPTICDLIHAGYPILWVQTHEEDRAIKSIAKCLQEDKEIKYEGYEWDLASGLKPAVSKTGEVKADINGPVEILEYLKLKFKDTQTENQTYFLKDFHRYTNSIDVVRRLKNLVPHLKDTLSRVVLVGPKSEIPIELEKDITPCEFDLPDLPEIKKIADEIIKASAMDVKYDTLDLEAALGLTAVEAENSIALSLAISGKIERGLIEVEKLNAVRKSGLLEQFADTEESELGGLAPLKAYIHSRRRGFTEDGLPRPKGIILAGLPGSGKSLSAKVVANVLGMPLLRLDISALKGSLVGESETKMRSALRLIDAVAPAVVWIDEIEKALGGVQSSNRTDGGTTSAMFGYLLTWMQESKKPKYIVATCNDIDDLLQISQGALLRRFDDVFFLDVPSRKERLEILRIMNKRYGQTIDEELVSKMTDWTGAEIEKFVIGSVYEGVDKAMAMTRPIYHKNRERIDAARRWALENARYGNDRDPEKDAASSYSDVLAEEGSGRRVTGKKNSTKSE